MSQKCSSVRLVSRSAHPASSKTSTASRGDARREVIQPCASSEPIPAIRSRSSALQPAAREPRALEAAPDMRILPHRAPHEVAAMVLDHGDDRSLVDAEIVIIDPAEARNATPVMQRHVVVEARIECIEKSILRVDMLAVA